MDLKEGLLREEKGDLQGAVRYYLRELQSATDSSEQAELLIRIGNCLLETDLDEADARIGEARRAAESASNDTLLGEAELLEGRLAQLRGSHRLALSRLTSAAERLQNANGSLRVDVALHLASAERARGELKLALERLESIDSFEISADLAVKAEYLDELGAVHLARGDFRAAIDTLTEALQLDARLDPRAYKSGRSRLLLAEAYMGRGERSRSKRYITEAIEIFENAETGLSEAYALYGQWYEDQGEYQQAARFYRDGQNIDHDSDDDLGEARALRRLARIARKRGDLDQSREYIERAQSLLAGTDDDVEVAALVTEEGHLAIEESDYDRAIARFTDALRRIEEDGDERRTAIAKRSLALALWEKGDSERAVELLLDARTVLEDRGDLRELDDLLDDLAEVQLDRDEYALALESAQNSLRIDEQLDSTISRARSLLLIGRALLRLGDRERAGDNFRRALEIFENDEVASSDALFYIGEYYADEGRLRDALKAFRSALLLDSRHNDIVGIARAHRGLAGVYRRQGNLSRAREHIDDATSELLRITDPAEKALLSLEAGRIALDKGDLDVAEKIFREGARVFESLHGVVKAATCNRLLAIVLASRARFGSALELLEKARADFERFNALPELDQLFDDVALVKLQMGLLDEAQDAVERSLVLGNDMSWSRGKGRSELILAQVAMRRPDPDTAKARVEDALRSYADADDEVGIATAKSLLGDVAVMQRDHELAIRSFKEARRIQQSHGDLTGLARSFRKLGEVYYQRREFQRAEEAFEQAEDHLRAADDPRERGPLYLVRGELAAAMGDHRSAIRHFERALGYFRDGGSPERVTEVYRHLAASHQTIDEFDQAMLYMREMGLEQAALWKSLLESLHPELQAAVTPRYLAGEYQDAVVAAFTLLERAVEERTLDLESRDGRPLSVGARLRHFISESERGLEPFVDAIGLQSFQNFCVGGFGVVRNSAVHGWREFNGVDAFAGIAVAHLIATLLDAPGDTRPLLGSTASD